MQASENLHNSEDQPFVRTASAAFFFSIRPPMSSTTRLTTILLALQESGADSRHSFVRQGSFLRPGLAQIGAAARRRCQGWRSHHQRRLVLDGSEHGSMLDAAGTAKFFDAARGALLLFGMDTVALPDGMRKMKRNNLRGVLTVAHTVGTSCGAISLHPSSREGHLPPEAAETSSCVSVSRIGRRRHQAEAAFSFVHWNSVPSTQMRCMMTASLRASATIALFNPRFLAIFMAQALSHDHLTLRVITVWAPS